MAVTTDGPLPFVCCNHDNGRPDWLVDMSVRKRTRGSCGSAIDHGVSVFSHVSASADRAHLLSTSRGSDGSDERTVSE